MRVKTEKLIGVQLDYAVACSIDSGEPILHVTSVNIFVELEKNVFSPSRKWDQCGELMEKYSISCYQSADPATGKVLHWVGVSELASPGKRRGLIAYSPRVAVCRAVVFARFGDEIELPDELERAV